MEQATAPTRKRKCKDADEQQSPFELAALLEAPERFYCRPSLMNLADVVLVASGGTRLRTHSHILALAGPVLQDAFTAQLDNVARGPTELRSPFKEFSASALAMFLRLAYDHKEASVANLKQVPGPLLSELLRLLVVLQADRLLCTLLDFGFHSSEATVEQLCSGIHAASACRLDVDRGLVRKKLQGILAVGGKLGSANSRALAALGDRKLLAQLLSGLAWGTTVVSSLDWDVEGFSTGALKTRYSSTFRAAGTKWFANASINNGYLHMRLYVHDPDLRDKLPLRARAVMSVHGSSPEDTLSETVEAEFITHSYLLHAKRVASLEQLSDPAHGRLEGDTLRLSVAVEAL
eukprot:scaffold4.g4897.t1